MLIEFSVENFLSFDERVTLSLVAAPELDATDGLFENTFEGPGGIRLLKSALLFGANASGKSNFVKAVLFAVSFIVGSAKDTQAGEEIGVKPFRLGADRIDRGSEIGLSWIDGNTLYKYSFSATASRVLAERLSRSVAGEEAETLLFERDAAGIRVSDAFAEGKDVVSRTRANALFLSVVAQLNGEESERILTWFRERLLIASGLEDETLMSVTMSALRDGELTDDILRLAREADLGITGISATEITPDLLPRGMSKKERQKLLSGGYGTLQVQHRTFDSAGAATGETAFHIGDESEGTQKFLALAGPLLIALRQGVISILDELDARLHPRLTRALVGLFHADTNPRNAQLVATTHDTNLLDRKLLRRDQIWFFEKTRRGATRLYSLAEFDDIPEDARYERDYLLGKYGGVPNIGDLVAPEPSE